MAQTVKVLTIREPWVSLIKAGKKHIETRSWKTNYRGTLYIHTGLVKINRKDSKVKEALKLLPTEEFSYGRIVLKCKLVDCIYMDKEYIKDIKENKEEYICGLYEEGRYAWILDDVKLISNPIKAKGKLNLWNFTF